MLKFILHIKPINMQQAGIGSRVVNFLVDTILIFWIALALYKWWTFYVRYADYKFFAYYWFFFATIFFYYSLFEILFSRTPGKWLSLTKVLSAGGGKPSWYQILFRSLVRLSIIDLFFIPFFDMTLHDMLSRTRTVEA